MKAILLSSKESCKRSFQNVQHKNQEVMLINFSFDNDEDLLFDERVTVRVDLPFVPRIGDVIYLPQIVLAKLDRMIEDLPRNEKGEWYEMLKEDSDGDEREFFLETFIIVSSVGLKMEDEYPIWVELSEA